MRRKKVHTEESFEVRRSSNPQRGSGVFALATVYKGETIGYYTGKILTDAQANRRPHVDSRYLMYVCKDHWINAEGPLANYMRYVNHSGKPNAQLVTSSRWKTARIECTRTIRPGQEVFYDYGDEYWEVLDVNPV